MQALPPDIDAIANLTLAAEIRSGQIFEMDTSALSPRHRAVHEAACGAGVRGGLAESAKKVREWLASREALLDGKFDFAPLVLRNGVLPAVVTDHRDLVTQEKGPYSIRAAGREYAIIEPAYFSTVVPTWRNWLYVGLPVAEQRVEMPARQFFPRDAEEKKIWSNAVRNCWQTGRQQAEQILDVNMSKLERDYAGMLRFHNLMRQGVISEPQVKVVVEDAIRRANTLTLRDTTRTITQQPSFNPGVRLKAQP